MIHLALLLAAGSPAEASIATAPTLLDLEVASDAFARCFEPRLARDPVILKPPGERVAFEELDNEVSNAAAQACLPLLEEGHAKVGKVAGHPGIRRWLGLRLMAQRNAYYLSRGRIGLTERQGMRPYFLCIVGQIAAGGASAGSTNELRAEKANQACAAHRYRPPGDGPLAAAAAAAADLYQDGFAGDAARFMFKPNGSPANFGKP